jgi:RNA polymerase sigma-70 factor (ECF subfamily)
MPDLSDSMLLQRFKQGDRQAVGLLLDRLRPYVRVILRTVQGDRSLAIADESDLIQDVFLQAVRSAENFQGSSFGELVRWLRMMAVRTSQKALVGQVERQPSVTGGNVEIEIVDDEVRRPEALILQQENSAQMAAALNRLPEEMRDVLLFRLADGLSHAEVAERMDRSAGAVRMLFLRAIERLREVYGTGEPWL